MECEAVMSKRGFFVETWSGFDEKRICDIGGRDDVRHYVSVRNLNLYKADLRVDGRITSHPPHAEFRSRTHADTGNHWSGSVAGLDDSAEYTFSHAALVSVAPGRERVSTEIVITWPAPQARGSGSLSFRVTT